MTYPAIEVMKLGKRYRIGALQDQDKSIMDAITEMFTQPYRAIKAIARGGDHQWFQAEDTIWALRDVSFEVQQGEVIGVIGRNGAGKSTLLKILTRITSPTEGYAKIRGRVGALLEVGTGFNGELTGRENIYMSGAILGMRKAEIDRKLDEIISFSGVEKFVDTPVKRYSSGMYLRLAFAVAAHLEPQVLLVDEVLAVGDAEFQRKCLGKMSNVAGEGRTVLFVSHNLDAVRQLCQKTLWLKDGQLQTFDETSGVIDAYLAEIDEQMASGDLFPLTNAQYGIGIEEAQVELRPNEQGYVDLIGSLCLSSRERLPRVGIGLSLSSESGQRVMSYGGPLINATFDIQPGLHRFAIEIPNLNRTLAAGTYAVGVWVALTNVERLIEAERLSKIHVPGVDIFGSGRYVEFKRHGPVILPLTIREA